MTIHICFHSADNIHSLKSSLSGTTFFDDRPTKCKGLESSRKESFNIGQTALCARNTVSHSLPGFV